MPSRCYLHKRGGSAHAEFHLLSSAEQRPLNHHKFHGIDLKECTLFHLVGYKKLNPTPKTCAVCGREIQWRKKWQANWHNVKYCSRACRKADLTDVDIKLE
jgi:hypothetical protein